MTELQPPLLVEVAPKFAAELRRQLKSLEPGLVASVDSIRVANVCDCSQPGCASFEAVSGAGKMRHIRHLSGWLRDSFLTFSFVKQGDSGEIGIVDLTSSPELRAELDHGMRKLGLKGFPVRPQRES